MAFINTKKSLNNLTKILTDNVKAIDRSIKKKKMIKGIVFTASRNFLIIEKFMGAEHE